MSITSSEKQQIFDTYGKNQADTGSTAVQVALLTARIKNLTEHMKLHKKDYSTRRGLLILVGKRRSLLDYLKRENEQGYKTLIGQLGLRR